VRDALSSLSWVKDVTVHYDRKQATFVAERASFDEAAVSRVLEEAGFGMKAISK